MVLVATVFVLCWMQNQVYYLLMNLGGLPADFSSPYYHFTVVCIFLNPCINPLVYASKYAELRAATRGLLAKCFRFRNGGFAAEASTGEQSATVNTVNQ